MQVVTVLLPYSRRSVTSSSCPRCAAANRKGSAKSSRLEFSEKLSVAMPGGDW